MIALQMFVLKAYVTRFSSNLYEVIYFFQIHKIIGFAPGLLQVVMTNDVDMPVRQAGKLLVF